MVANIDFYGWLLGWMVALFFIGVINAANSIKSRPRKRK